jgi:hypothetical protein
MDLGDMNHDEQRVHRIVAALGVFAVAFAYFGFLTGYGYSIADEGAVIEQIERLADGERLYSDFHVGYTPGFYYSQALIMRAFGHSVMPIRWCLALANAASVALAFVIAASVSRRAWVGIAAAVVCLGAFPVHPGDFAMSNTPYPTWYNMLLWLAGAAVLLRFSERPSLGRLVIAGLFAGLAFTFKPNMGLFQLSATSMIVLSALPLRRIGEIGPISPSAVVWWSWWLGIVVGVVMVFSGGAGPREAVLFVVPVLAAALLVARRATRLTVDPRMPHPISAAVAVVGTFILINAPWLVFYYLELGRETFLKRVLFYNSGYEASYALNHPPVALPLSILFVVIGAARLLPGLLKKRGLRPDRLIALAFPVTVAVLVGAAEVRAMPEGFFRAMNVPFEFFVPGVTIAFHWLGLAVWMRMPADDKPQSSGNYAFGVVVVAAVFLYLQMYPRADFAHWVGGMAASGCLAALVVGRVMWHWRGESSALWSVFGTATALFLFCLFPAVRTANVLGATVEPGVFGRDIVRSASEKVPVWINAGASSWYADVDDLTGFIQSHTSPDEKVFYFPALGTISFMADRRNPTRHVYFFPGWPGREVEAEVIAWLRRDPPPLIVIGRFQQLYFAHAHAYYHVLKRYIEAEYRPIARLGRFLVLGHRDIEASENPPVHAILSFEESGPSDSVSALREGLASDDPVVRREIVERATGWYVRSYSDLLVGALGDPDQSVRNAAVWALRRTRDEAVSCALLDGALAGQFSARAYTVALRRGLNYTDDRCLDVLLEMEASNDPFVRNAGIIAISTLLSRARVEEHWVGGNFGLPERESAQLPGDLAGYDRIDYLMHEPGLNPLLRDFAVYLAGRSTDQRANALLLEASRELDLPRYRVRAMWELIKRGQGPRILDDALAHLGVELGLAPLVVHAAVLQTENGPARFAQFMRESSNDARVAALWVSAAVGGADSAEVAAVAVGSDSAIERAAAAWSLGNIGDAGHRDLLVRASEDPDPLVAEMARYGLEALEVRSY